MSTYPHERLLPILSALLIELHALQAVVQPADQHAKLDPVAIGAGLADLQTLACEALALVRSSLGDAPIPALDGVPLAEALSHLVEDTAEELGLASRIALTGADEHDQPLKGMLAPAAERLLYLVTRESLYQVAQHRDARRLRFAFHYRQYDVQMNLEDDGIPGEPDPDSFVPQENKSRAASSSQSMLEDALLTPVMYDLRYRLEQFGGKLDVEFIEPHGVRVRVSLPYRSRASESEPAVELSSSPAVASIVSPAGIVATTPEHVTILIVDSMAVTRAGLHRLLDTYPALSVIGEAVDGLQAVSESLELGPQVVLMDAQLPNGQSLEALRQIKQLNLNIKVLLLATHDREEYLYETLRAGADGYVLKDIAPDELAQAVQAVARGEILVQPQLAGRLLSRFGRQGRGNGRFDTLTAREVEVLHLLARGLRNKEIAGRLYVSERTVNFHLANIYQKLNVSGRTEALSKALEQGLITP
jgi:DNA-binding NarL/FixJ family response regulator